jgi:mono/diheme cytochrome c family protein
MIRKTKNDTLKIEQNYKLNINRCHGVDGRGVWDIPDVPDFTNARWQSHRSDAQLARITLEGRGAVMPAFRGTLTLEEAWAMARYLRRFMPGTETPRPDTKAPENQPEELPAPKPAGRAAALWDLPARLGLRR